MKKTGTSTLRTSTRQHFNMKNIIISIFTLIVISSQAQPQRTITLDQAIGKRCKITEALKLHNIILTRVSSCKRRRSTSLKLMSICFTVSIIVMQVIIILR